MSVERTVDHTLDDEMADTDVLATLEERERNRMQMQEIARRTVRPGLLRLKVENVTSAENSEQWAIDVAHPTRRDPIRIFAEKPIEGWSDDYKIVKLLRWVGEESTRDPHKLEFHDLYMKKDPENSSFPHDWMAVEPPDYEPPMKIQFGRHWRTIRSELSGLRPSMTNAKMFGVMLAGVLMGPSMHDMYPEDVQALVPTTATVLLTFLFVTLVGMVVLDK